MSTISPSGFTQGSQNAMDKGIKNSLETSQLGMSGIAKMNEQAINDMMTQGVLSAQRSYAEAQAKTLKAGADSVKGLV